MKYLESPSFEELFLLAFNHGCLATKHSGVIIIIICYYNLAEDSCLAIATPTLDY